MRTINVNKGNPRCLPKQMMGRKGNELADAPKTDILGLGKDIEQILIKN